MSLVKKAAPAEAAAPAPAATPAPAESPAPPSDFGGNRAASESKRLETPAAPAERPDYVPEKFWKDGKLDAEAALKSYGELETKLRTKTEDLLTQIKSEARAGVPETPDKYEVKLENPPIPADQLEKHPAFEWWRSTAHAMGVPQEKFNEGVGQLMGILTQGPDLEAETKKLGENADTRIAAVSTWARSTFTSPEEFAAVQLLGTSAAGIKVLERLMGSSAPSTSQDLAPAAPVMTPAKLRSMQADPRYWDQARRDNDWVKQVDEGFAQLYAAKK